MLVSFHSAVSQLCTATAATLFIRLLSTVKNIQMDLTLCSSSNFYLFFVHFGRLLTVEKAINLPPLVVKV